MTKVFMIVAACEGNGIGKGGSLPWRLPKEMKYFAKMTKDTEDKSKKVSMGHRAQTSCLWYV